MVRLLFRLILKVDVAQLASYWSRLAGGRRLAPKQSADRADPVNEQADEVMRVPAPLRYEELALPELAALDRERTVFLWAVSPIEVHGPHLPVGTDVLVAEEVQRRYVAELDQRHPELQCVILPSLHAGADALPIKGSLSVPATVLEGMITAYAKGLAAQGFRYLLLSDNHGGPRHGLGIEAAVRTAWRKWRFCVIDPFTSLYRKMVECDSELLRRTGLAAGSCGDDSDAHAGTNETSLMMVAAPQCIRAAATQIGASVPEPLHGLAKLVDGIGRFLTALGGRQLGPDVRHLAATLNWVGDPAMKPYMGDPGRATPEAGEAMLRAHLDEAMALLDAALSGQPLPARPILWSVRVLRRVPE
jgi:creatinine amidohydrolase